MIKGHLTIANPLHISLILYETKNIIEEWILKKSYNIIYMNIFEGFI